MSKKNVSAKGNVSAKSTIVENKLSAINLEKFASQLDAVNVTEKKQFSRESLYIFPDDIKTSDDINGKKGKSFRNKMRSQLDFHVNAILFSAKTNPDQLQSKIDSFDAHYKTFYKRNDYSIGSISNRSEDKNVLLSLALGIIKEIKGI